MKIFLFLISLLCLNQAFAYWLGSNFSYGETTPLIKFSNSDASLSVNPNPINDMTLSMIGPSYSVGIQFVIEKEDDGDFLQSNYSDSRISFYTDSYIASLSFTSFEDFYVLADRDLINSNQLNETLSGTSLEVAFLFYLDDSKVYELHGENILSPKTGVGYFLNLSIEHGDIKGADELIPQKYQADFKELQGIKSFNYDSLISEVGVSGVYTFEKIYLSSTLQLGPNLTSQVTRGDNKVSSTMITPKGEGVAGIAYYDDSMQFGVRVKSSIQRHQVNGANIDMAQNLGYLFFTYLF